MHIIFGQATYWQIPLMIILKSLGLKVYYLYINVKSDFKKNEIATKLKKNNIFPLPIELEKKITSYAGYNIVDSDPNEFSFKKCKKLIPDSTLKKYSCLFSIDEKNTKKLRLLIFETVRNIYAEIGILKVWSDLYPKVKIIYVNFDFKYFYMPDVDVNNIFKITIPLNFLNYFIKIINIKKISSLLLSFINKINKEQKKQILNLQNIREIEKKSVAFVVHKGLIFGTKDKILFEKSLYYSDDINSCLNKRNILHLDYENFLSPDENLHWICLKKIKVSNAKIFLKTLLASIKTCYLIRSWSTFLGWLLCIKKYSTYIKYCEVINKFKNLKIAIIDYDVLCPKTLILAFEKNNINTVATQERFIHTFRSMPIIVDTYYLMSEFTANYFKNSKYYDIKNLIPVGQYRSDYLSLYKKKIVPEEIAKAKATGKKIIVVLGYHSESHWFESYISIQLNWSSQKSFLEDVIRLSQNLNDTFIVVRYPSIDWITNVYFKKILKKINDCENIIISDNYKKPLRSYKLCAHADLVIAKHTSLADECLVNEIPLLFYEYTHNIKKLVSVQFDYLSSKLMCYNFEELLEKSKSLLFDSSSELKEEILKLNNTVYYLKDKGNVKNRIITECMKIIQRK